MAFHYSFCLLKSNNSHRLLISCTCTTQTIRRTTRTRSSSFINNGHLDNSGFHPQHAGGELGRLAEHLPPHRPRRMLLTRLMWSTRKSKVSFFSHLVRSGNISPVCISGVQGSDGSIFHEGPPEVRFDVRHEPPITRRLKFRSTPRRCTRLCTTNVYNRTVRAHFAIRSKTDQEYLSHRIFRSKKTNLAEFMIVDPTISHEACGGVRRETGRRRDRASTNISQGWTSSQEIL